MGNNGGHVPIAACTSMECSSSMVEPISVSSSCSPVCDNISQNFGVVSHLEWAEDVTRDWKLLRASADGDVHGIREALDAGAGVDTVRSLMMVPQLSRDAAMNRLDGECAEKDPEVTSASLKPGKKRSSKIVDALTPLMRASRAGHPMAVQLLLDARASPHLRDSDCMRPLHFAAEAACRDSVSELLRARADPSALDDQQRDAYACLPKDCTAPFNAQRGVWLSLLRPSKAGKDVCLGNVPESNAGCDSNSDRSRGVLMPRQSIEQPVDPTIARLNGREPLQGIVHHLQ